MTEAHKTDNLAELVCSNSFRSDDMNNNAVGLLHAEMRELNSLIMKSADKNKIPAGGALAVDREEFSKSVHESIISHPLIKIINQEYKHLPNKSIKAIIATGPLTSKDLAEKIKRVSGRDLDIVVENDTGGYENSGDNTRFCEESGIKFQNIDDSIKKIYNWYNQNSSIIDEKLFVY